MHPHRRRRVHAQRVAGAAQPPPRAWCHRTSAADRQRDVPSHRAEGARGRSHRRIHAGQPALREGRERLVERDGRADRTRDLSLQLHDRRRADDRSGQSGCQDRIDAEHDCRASSRCAARSPAFYDRASRSRTAISARTGISRRSLGSLRRLTVYMPPGLRPRSRQTRYPCSICFMAPTPTRTHGIGSAGSTRFSTTCSPPAKTKPFIVVMPFGYGVPPDAPAAPGREHGGSSARI